MADAIGSPTPERPVSTDARSTASGANASDDTARTLLASFRSSRDRARGDFQIAIVMNSPRVRYPRARMVADPVENSRSSNAPSASEMSSAYRSAHRSTNASSIFSRFTSPPGPRLGEG